MGTDCSQTGPRLVAGPYRLTEVLGRGGMGIYNNGSAAEALALSPDGKYLVYKSGSDLWLWETGIGV